MPHMPISVGSVSSQEKFHCRCKSNYAACFSLFIFAVLCFLQGSGHVSTNQPTGQYIVLPYEDQSELAQKTIWSILPSPLIWPKLSQTISMFPGVTALPPPTPNYCVHGSISPPLTFAKPAKSKIHFYRSDYLIIMTEIVPSN